MKWDMSMRRRDFIVIAGAAAGAAVIGRRYITGGIRSVVPDASARGTSEVTPNNEFYITHYNGIPELTDAEWSLKITGEVEREVELTLEDLKRLEETLDYNTLICIGNGIGGSLIGNARWRGVRLGDVLRLAGVLDGAVDVVLHGADGYSDSFPVEKALHPDTRLVYEMNGEPLPQAHGYPLRAVVPGLYGIKNVKWIERIEVAAEEVLGHWQKRGWSREGRIKVMSRIDVPGDGAVIGSGVHTVSGIAFAGEHPITKVEVSTDGGGTWREAALKPPLSRYAWTLWSYEWAVPGPGVYTLAVRAADESGRVQEPGNAITRRAFPDGAWGYHSIRVRAV
ncbi:MAG: oxidoreductase [Methanobacteriota archaeon]|nr:MAG: oxidoreductase [Euryarchaeota archaeon]